MFRIRSCIESVFTELTDPDMDLDFSYGSGSRCTGTCNCLTLEKSDQNVNLLRFPFSSFRDEDKKAFELLVIFVKKKKKNIL